MDMMRPVTVKVPRALPAAPVLSFTRGSVDLTWTDGTPFDHLVPASWANPGTAEVVLDRITERSDETRLRQHRQRITVSVTG
jgi:hypothetical protein